MSKKYEPQILEIPCLVNGCYYTAIQSIDCFVDVDREVKLHCIKGMINKLKIEHERGEHLIPRFTHTCNCHCHCKRESYEP